MKSYHCTQLFAGLALLAVVTVLMTAAPASAQQVIGYSELTFNKSAGQVDTWSETAMDANTAANYDAYVEGYVFINGTNVNSGYATGNPTAGGGFTETLTIGDTYEIDSYHYLIQYFGYYDQYGNAYYYNPYYYLADGTGDGYDPNGSAYTNGGGPLYYENYQYLFLGATWVYVDTHPPNITSMSPTDGSVESSGTISLGGTNLEDIFTQSTQPAITGSGVTLSVQSVTPTAVTLGYSIAENATPGAQTLTLTTYFGTSNGKTFTVGDPTPVVKTVSPSTWDAGNSYSVTIGGTGFGTKPTVTLSGTGVSFVQSTGGDTQITGTVTVAGSAPDQTITVTVQNNGYYGWGFTQTYPGQSQDGSNTATVAAIPAPAPKILWNGTDVTGKTGNKVVTGQQVALTTSETLPSGLAITSNSWTIGGTVVGGYNASVSSGNVVVPTLTGTATTFHWVYAGQNLQATYSYCMNNNQCSQPVNTAFTVSGPTGGKMTTVHVGTVGITTINGNPYLQFGTSYASNAGVRFSPSATPPSGFANTFIWAQLISNDMMAFTSSSGTQNCNGGTGLDNVYPYPPISGSSDAGDSPAVELLSTDTKVTRAFSAQMYLMWSSGLANSIPVPLGSIKWSFSGTANKSGGSWSATGSSNVGSFVASSPSQNFDGYPTWNTHVVNGVCQSDTN